MHKECVAGAINVPLLFKGQTYPLFANVINHCWLLKVDVGEIISQARKQILQDK